MENNILNYRGYETKIHYSAEDQLLYGKIEGISDLINFESEDSKKIEQEFHDAVNDYLAFCKEIGKSTIKEQLLKENICKIEEFSKYQKNWNEYGSVPFNKLFLFDVVILLSKLDIQPFVSPVAGGAIQMEWVNVYGDYVEILIAENESPSVLHIANGKEEEYIIPCFCIAKGYDFNEMAKQINKIINNFIKTF